MDIAYWTVQRVPNPTLREQYHGNSIRSATHKLVHNLATGEVVAIANPEYNRLIENMAVVRYGRSVPLPLSKDQRR